MHAPSHITEALFAIHPQARLGWLGEERLSPEEPLNKGKFALLQLYYKHAAERTYYGELWNDRGPVFGRPYDHAMRVPIMLALLDPMQVLNGAFLCACDGCLSGINPCPRLYCQHQHDGVLIRRWMMPMYERGLRAAEEKGREYQTQLDNLAGELGSEVYWEAKRNGAVINTPHKALTADDKAVLGGEKLKGLKNTYVDKMKTDAQRIE